MGRLCDLDQAEFLHAVRAGVFFDEGGDGEMNGKETFGLDAFLAEAPKGYVRARLGRQNAENRAASAFRTASIFVSNSFVRGIATPILSSSSGSERNAYLRHHRRTVQGCPRRRAERIEI